MTVRDLRERLRPSSTPERFRLLGKVLREAKDTDAWLFTSPHEVFQLWHHLSPHLGRRKAFWEFLLGHWRAQGLLGR